MKKFLSTLIAFVCVIACAFSLTACGDNGDGGTHTKHNWSSTYTPDGDRHYQTCDGCDEKKYSNHDYGTSGVCVCGKTKPDNYVAVTSVTLNKTSLTLDIGESETLTATVLPNNATYKTVSWSSDNPSIADVDDNGTVTAYSDGAAIITATADGVSVTCTVTVNKATTTTTNAYAKIAQTCKAFAEKDGKTNVEILVIYDSEGYLTFGAKHSTGYTSYIVAFEIGITIESAKAVDIAALSNAEYFDLNSFGNGAYNTDSTDDDKQLVQNMITKLLGDDYTVMYGTISGTSNNMDNPILGPNASFTVKALLEKDGNVFEYSQRLTVSKSYGDVYQTVLDSTEDSKDNRYIVGDETLTDLGEVAKLYLEECKRHLINY